MQLLAQIDPAELTGFVRAALADRDQNQFRLSEFLPNREVNDLMYRFNQGGQGLADAATFRSPDSEASIGARPNVMRVTGELPPISRKIRLGEYDQLRLRNAPDSELADAVFNDAERMATQIAARLELARGEALHSGQIVLDENGVKATVSFGRSGTHSVSAGTPWTTVASADIINDLTTWQNTYIATNGEPPGAAIISTRILGLIQRNAALSVTVGSLAGAPGIVSRASIDQAMLAYGLPRLIVNDEMVRVGGVSTRVIPDDKVVFVPNAGSELGATLYGLTLESQEPGYNLVGNQAGVVAGAYKTEDPIAIWTKAAAIALPVLANPDLTFTADVAA